MRNRSRVSTRSILPLAASAAILLAACQPVASSPAAATPGVPGQSAAPVTDAPSSLAPAGTPGPTAQQEMAIAFLPDAADPGTVQVACEEAAAGGDALPCDEIVVLAARIAATITASSVTKVSVERPAENPTLAEVTFWAAAEEGEGETAFTSTINPTASTVTFPAENADAVFPG